MNYTGLHIGKFFKAVIGIVFTFCILMSSCAVKSAFKSLLDKNNSRSHSSVHAEKLFSGGSKCAYSPTKDDLVKGDVKAAQLDIPALFTATLVIHGAAGFPAKIQEHPLYTSSTTWNTVPIFIQYGKLII